MAIIDRRVGGSRWPNTSTAITYQITSPDDIVVSSDPEAWVNAPDDAHPEDANLPAPEEAHDDPICCGAPPDCSCAEIGGEG